MTIQLICSIILCVIIFYLEHIRKKDLRKQAVRHASTVKRFEEDLVSRNKRLADLFNEMIKTNNTLNNMTSYAIVLESELAISKGVVLPIEKRKSVEAALDNLIENNPEILSRIDQI